MLQLKQIAPTNALDGLESRRHFLRILFVHRSLADIERCLHELKRVGFTVSSDVVVTPEQFADRLRSQYFDLVLAEYLSSSWQGTQVLDCLRQTNKEIPLIYLVYFVKRETVEELILKVPAIVSKCMASIYPWPSIALRMKWRCGMHEIEPNKISTVGSTLPHLGRKSELRHLPLRSRR